MRTTSTKQRSHLIGRQVCEVALIALFVFAPHPLATSMAQSEDPEYKTPAPTTPPAIQGNSLSLRPKITYREKAKYTEEARDNVIHGTVALNVVFRSDGSLSDIKVVKGLPYGLTEKAIDAARKIRFEPAIKDGQPVHVRGDLEFTFHLYDLEEKSIHKMLRNDFPVLSKDAVQALAKVIYKRGDRDSEKAWRFAQQCLEAGLSKLPPSEQEELTSLTLEAEVCAPPSLDTVAQNAMLFPNPCRHAYKLPWPAPGQHLSTRRENHCAASCGLTFPPGHTNEM